MQPPGVLPRGLRVRAAVAGVDDDADFLDAGAQRSVTCTGIQETRLPDGRMKVAANLRNRENRRIEVQANCVFKDEQAFAMHALEHGPLRRKHGVEIGLGDQ